MLRCFLDRSGQKRARVSAALRRTTSRRGLTHSGVDTMMERRQAKKVSIKKENHDVLPIHGTARYDGRAGHGGR
jgi:hypothetical protein